MRRLMLLLTALLCFGGALAQQYEFLGIQLSLTNSVLTIKASPGPLLAYECYNPNAANAFVQVFDSTTGVVLGTTVPNRSLPVAGLSSTGLQNPSPPFAGSTGLQAAGTTTSNGSAAPAQPLRCEFYTR